MKASIETVTGGVTLNLNGEAKGTMSLEAALAAIRKADQDSSADPACAIQISGMDDGIGVEV